VTARATHSVQSIWHGWLSALQFLTIIHWGSNRTFDARAALPFFPICGLCIGALIVAMDTVATLFWPRPVVALVDLMALVLISGALHIDGVADTADGLYGQRKPEHAMAIMKDSHIGAMGLVAVLCCFTAKWAGLIALGANAKLWLFLVPAYARAAVIPAIKVLPYGRPEGGTGQAFFNKPLGLSAFWGFVPLVLISLLMGFDALKINLGFVLMVGLVLRWYQRKLGAITGDMLGALIEFTEAGLFILAATQWIA
jgi:adenosylcobinamide-GDP ribazoletransferase